MEARRSEHDAPTPLGPAPEIDDAIAPEQDRWLVCAACGASITTARERREVEGAHVHARVNPSGLEFRFGCFGDAPGCAGWGDISTFFAWFPGYSWQIVLCRGCGAHLGWLFRSEGDRFFGLVLDRLRDGPAGARPD